jgi:hypothetical protein
MNPDNIREFTLVLGEGVSPDTRRIEDILYKSCKDALVHYSKGTIYIDFFRVADTMEEAIVTAIEAVEAADRRISVVEVRPLT